MEEVIEAFDSSTKLAFNTAWLRLRLALKAQNAPDERLEALAAMRESAKHRAIARLREVYSDVAAYHPWIAEMCAESTQTRQFIRLKDSVFGDDHLNLDFRVSPCYLPLPQFYARCSALPERLAAPVHKVVKNRGHLLGKIFGTSSHRISHPSPDGLKWQHPPACRRHKFCRLCS